MIQRIQTVYLLIIAIIMAIPLFAPIAQVLVPNDASYNFFTYGVVMIGQQTVLQANYWALLILNIFMIGLPFVTIFLYKKRFLQIRLCIAEIILLLGSMILMWYHINQFQSNIDADIIYKISFILPLVCVILAYMAMRGIFKDIKLLKSLDRIR